MSQRENLSLLAMSLDAFSRIRRVAAVKMATVKLAAVRITVVALLLAIGPMGTVSAASLNVLFFGNSFTEGLTDSYNVPSLFAEIATAAGKDTPNALMLASPGQDLGYYVQNANAVFNLLTPTTWDFVVMQDFSTLPTHIGDVDAHRVNAVALYQAVVAHDSPDVVPVMFETWARGPGNDLYLGATPEFPGGPDQMQDELHDAYFQSAGDIGPIARVAAVGDAFQSVGFDASLYHNDGQQYHASPLGTLTAALVMYATIYNDPHLGNIDLSGFMTELNLSEADIALARTAAQGGLLVPVPEPSSIVLIVAGLLSVAFFYGRRR